MAESATALSSWESFYVIVGSSGGALIGLQFVVVTLIAERRPASASSGALSAFGTPTVVHFAGALVLSAIMSAPWHSYAALSAAIGVGGIGGIAYAALILYRVRHQSEYQPVFEDWVWYLVLPWADYVALTSGAILLRSNTQLALYMIGAATLALLLVGIHNAWDTVTHIVSLSGDEPRG